MRVGANSAVLFLTMAIVAAACRPRETGQPPPRADVPGEVTGPLLFSQYPLEDPACQSRAEPVTIDTAVARFFDGARVNEQRASGLPFRTEETIAGGGVVQSVFYNLYQKAQCTLSDRGEKSCDSPQVVVPRRGLRICHNSRTYARTSYEGVALTAMFHLEAANAFYRGLSGAKKLDLAALSLFPRVEEQQIRSLRGDAAETVLQRDNLGYSYQPGATAQFVVYPQSGTPSASVGLWEIPWAMGHEFFHHVFRHHTGVSGMERLGNNEAVASWRAANEGFSDLGAFFSRDGHSQLGSVACLGNNRDVAVDTFAGGRRKILTADLVNEYLSAPVNQSSIAALNCAPSFRDPHVIGAAIARGINQLFAHVASDGTAGVYKARSALALQWLSGLETLQRQKGAAQVTLVDILRSALEVTRAAGEKNGAVGTRAAIDQTFKTYFSFAAQHLRQ